MNVKTIEQRAQEYASSGEYSSSITEAYKAGAAEEHRLLTEWHEVRERPERDGSYLLKNPSKDGFFYSVGKYCFESDTWDCGIYLLHRVTSKLRFSHWRPIHE